MLAEIGDLVLAQWEALGLAGDAPRSLTYLGVWGRVEGGTTTFLAFGEASARPAFVVKIHRRVGAEAPARAEASLLSRLAQRSDLAGSIPRAVALGQIGGTWYLVQTALSGRPMPVRGPLSDPRRAARAAADLRRAGQWLLGLHTGEPLAADRAGLTAAARETFDRLVRSFALSPAQRAALAELDLDAAGAAGAFIEHGDFTPHNLLVAPEGLRVIDWTDARPMGFALQDLFLFATSYVLRARAAAGLEAVVGAFAQSFLERGLVSAVVRSEVHRHATVLGIERGALPALFALFLAQRCLREAELLERCSELGTWPRFSLHVAATLGVEEERLAEAQLWIHLLRAFLERPGAFLS